MMDSTINEIKKELEHLKEAYHDLQIALAAALLKNGGSMEFNYHDFFDMKRNNEYEFMKQENFHNDSVTISIKKKKLINKDTPTP